MKNKFFIGTKVERIQEKNLLVWNCHQQLSVEIVVTSLISLDSFEILVSSK